MLQPDLLLEPLETPDVMAAKLLLPGGSVEDPMGQRGAHQLLGSLMTRGCGHLDHVQLADLVEGRGAGLRCEAHEDSLLISLRCNSSDAADLLPLLAWMVNESHLDQEQLELERSLSLQALQRQNEDPFQLAFDAWRQLVYGNHGYGHDPLGIESELASLDRHQLLPLAERLRTGRAALAIAGVWPAELENDLATWSGFREWPAPGGSAPEREHRSPSGHPERRLISSCLDTEQVVLMLGQSTVPHGHPDDLALRLLHCHLGVGMSSLLFRRLREEHGVAYDVGVHHPCRAQQAPFVMHASTSAERAALSLRLLQNSWDELASQPLSEEDLELARSKFIGQMAHSCQTSAQRAERRVQLHGLALPADHDMQCSRRLEQITAVDLQQVAARRLTRPCLSLSGPSATLSTLERSWPRPEPA